MRWLLYGAYGYTGALVAAEAVRRGHRPILAGRSARRLAPLADRLGLDWLAVDLADSARLRAALRDVALVFHAAGPFVHTSAPMVQACLTSATHYVDISGEVPVLERTLALDAAARQRGIAVVGGAGLDVVPTDCLAR